MALIGKIREQSVLLLVVIGLSMLAFILGDIQGLFGSSAQNNVIGEISGEEIDANTYFSLESNRVNTQAQGRVLSEVEKARIKNGFWQEFVSAKVLENQLSVVGIQVTKEELNDMLFGENPHPYITSTFVNKDGQFDKNVLIQQFNYMQSTSVEQDPTIAERKASWNNFLEQLLENRKQQKYADMIKGGVFVNKLEAQFDLEAKEDKRQVRFVLKRFTDIPDTDVNVTDDALLAYYKDHKNDQEYQQKDSREVNVLELTISASQADHDYTLERVGRMKKGFIAAKNDTSYVNFKSESKLISPDFIPSINFGVQGDALIQAADTNEVVGPFLDNGVYKLVKVKAIGTRKEAKVRHILISTGNGKKSVEEAQALADSIKKVIVTSDNFEEMVLAHSEDPGSISTGGVYEWFPEGRMVAEFNDAAFNGKEGKIQVVTTTYGVHVVEVLGKREGKTVKVMVVDRKIKPSTKTIAGYKDMAYEITSIATDSLAFVPIKKPQYRYRSIEIDKNQFYVSGFTNPTNLIKAAENGLQGAYFGPIVVDEKVIIGYVNKVKVKGTPDFEDIKERLKVPVKNKLKAEKIIANIGSIKGLEEISASISAPIYSADVSFNNYSIPNGGADQIVIGKIFGLNIGEVSQPISDVTGVYVVKFEQDLAQGHDPLDVERVQGEMNTSAKNAAFNKALDAVKDASNVIDNRDQFKR